VACELLAVPSYSGLWPCGRFGDIDWLDLDLLGDDIDQSRRCAVFSGVLTDDRFAPDPRNWLIGAREQLQAVCVDLDARVLLRPHHAHVLNDVPGTRSLLQDRGGRPVALDLAALLAPSMVRDAAPHIDRILHGLSTMAGAILLSDACVDADGRTCAVHMGRGVLPGVAVGQALRRWVEPHLPDDVPVAVVADSVEDAYRWLGWL
jgi:hypothetical protein